MKFQIFLVLIFSFIYGLLSAPEGVKSLGKRVGISIPTPKPDPDATTTTKRSRSSLRPGDLTFCDLANDIVNRLIDFNRPLDDIPPISIPATHNIYLNLTIDSISCSGLDRTVMPQCITTPNVEDGYEDTFVQIFIDKFGMYLTNYTLDGMAGHLPLQGQGDGSIKMENFTLSCNGTTYKNEDNKFQFRNLTVDLFVYQWTVNLENLMPGTDIGILANEVISEEGREVMNAIEEILNFDNLLMNIINELIVNISPKLLI